MRTHFISFLRIGACMAIALTFSQCIKRETPTRAEALELAKRIEKSVVDRDTTLLNDLLDPREFALAVDKTAGMRLSDDLRKGVMEGVVKARFGNQIINTVGRYGTFKLVKEYEKDKVAHLIFRQRSTAGVNYLDYSLIKKNGKLVATDIYMYLSGQLYSQTVTDLLDLHADSSENKVDGRTENIQKLRSTMTLINRKDYISAKEVFESVDSGFKSSRLYRITAIRLDAGLHDTAALRPAVKSYIADFPDAQEINFIMIDVCFDNEDYQGAIEAINRLDKFIDKDPLQDHYRGLAYKKEGKTDSAIACFERAYRAEPDIASPYIELMVIYLKNDRPADAQAVIRRYKANKAFDQSVFEVLSGKYPEYRTYFD